MKILFIGDIVGEPGRALLRQLLPKLRATYAPDAIIVNGENTAADGRGITPPIMEELLGQGVDLVTSGNHIWAKKEILDYIRTSKKLLRPANFPGSCPGTGAVILPLPGGGKIGVINVMGRVFMRDLLDCPFRTAETAVNYLSSQTSHILVDIHAETTAEKCAIAHYLDGKVTAVVGTHTHVQTADERILPGGTAFISDVGMGGAIDSMIGMKKGPLVEHFVNSMPIRFAVETTGPMQLCAVLITADNVSKKAISIERIRLIEG